MSTNVLERFTDSCLSFLKKGLFFVGYRTLSGPRCISPKTRKHCVTFNLKMYGDRDSIAGICKTLNKAEFNPNVDVVIALPSVYLDFARSRLPQNINIAAEDVYKIGEGAFTGEISPAMLNDLSIEWVILGQSERRTIFKETDELIAEKCRHSLDEGLNVIACVGETLEERNNWESEKVIGRQLGEMAAQIKDWTNVVLAYEPVWTMGTGKAATTQEIRDMHYFIRNWLRKKVSVKVSNRTRIQYGGPITDINCRKLAKLHDLDGFLIGDIALTSKFLNLINCSVQ